MTLLELVAKHGFDPQTTVNGELMIICPLCQDQKARLYVNMWSGLWLCFHCEERGNIYSFCRNVLEMDHFEARHAMDRLPSLVRGRAATTGLMEFTGDQLRKAHDEVAPGIELPEEFSQLTYPDAPGEGPFWHYLVDTRGLAEYEVRQYHIGYCRRGLYAWRIIIPVRSNGILWTFVARSIHESPNYPKVLHPRGATPSRALFGIDRLMPGPHCVLVEGAFDAIKLGSIACATLGTNISAHQRDLLREKGVKKVTLLWDGDNAGRWGSVKVAEPLFAAGFNVWIGHMPEGEDPDSANFDVIGKAIATATQVERVGILPGVVGLPGRPDLLSPWQPRGYLRRDRLDAESGSG